MSKSSTVARRRDPNAAPSAAFPSLSLVAPVAPTLDPKLSEALAASLVASATEAPTDVAIEAPEAISSEEVLLALADSPEAAPKPVVLKANGKPSREAARYVKNAVEVNGAVYSSLYKAFLYLGLPLGRHIAFRAKLKDAGELAFDGPSGRLTFKVI